MGADIHAWVEVRKDGRWRRVEPEFPLEFEWRGRTTTSEPFSDRHYGRFAFLGDVRNYSAVPPLHPRRGIPQDCDWSEEDRAFYEDDGHSATWYTLDELLTFDYDQTFEERRRGADTCPEGEGEMTTFRDFLGPDYFRDLEIMRALASPEDVRVVLYFDN